MLGLFFVVVAKNTMMRRSIIRPRALPAYAPKPCQSQFHFFLTSLSFPVLMRESGSVLVR
jgi:hypothetical protein